MWKMRYELCGFTAMDDADSIYQHASNVHDIDLADLLAASRQPTQVSDGHFIYKLPDGRVWLDARRP